MYVCMCIEVLPHSSASLRQLLFHEFFLASLALLSSAFVIVWITHYVQNVLK